VGCGFLQFIRSLGFNIHTTISIREAGRTRVVDHPRVIIVGFRQRDLSGAAGNTTYFDVTTNDNGRAAIGGGRAPAIWEFNNLGDGIGLNACRNQRFTGFTTPLGTTDIFCANTIGIFFTAAPDSIDVQAPPATFTIYGQGISTAYGMPVIEFWNEYGTVVGQTTATEVAADGTWARGNTPYMDTSNMYGGAYTVGINNVVAGGGYDTIGYASLSVTNSNPPPLPEPYPDPTPDPCGVNQNQYMERQPCYENPTY
jgi:hypothetical protein